MFGWGRRKQPLADPNMEAAFSKAVEIISGFAPERRLAVAYGVAFAWKAFNSKFPSIEDFRRQSSRTKTQFWEGLKKVGEHLDSEGDQDAAHGVSLVGMYTLALVDGDAAMINRMAGKLEPFNREGSALLSV